MKSFLRYVRVMILTGLTVYIVLLIPDGESSASSAGRDTQPFAWNRDEDWKKLESQFARYRSEPGPWLDSICEKEQYRFESMRDAALAAGWQANDPAWDSLMVSYLRLAPLIAVNPARYQWYSSEFIQVRDMLKRSSRRWDVQDTQVRSLLYKVLYGMRTALEEVALQMPRSMAPGLLTGTDETSVTDSARIFGITVHSGDILVSRGGADVSAFIARGNDYPGNFSHIALLYVDGLSHVPYLIEAHIEKGVAISSVHDYLKDTKRRFMVLRLRADLPEMKQAPELPHLAAKHMFDAAQQHHIPYDFRLDHEDSSAMFCSEVASVAYASQHIQTWQSLSTISGSGVRQWLHDFGVDHFNTKMPSDLEYDPQFTVVGEWRDMETLYLDHIDNAVMDAWYEAAEKGTRIGYNLWKLPLARVIKAYCMVINQKGGTGLIPEGMTATQALRNERFSAMHKTVRQSVLSGAERFRNEQGYRAPYWKLLEMAREAVKEKLG